METPYYMEGMRLNERVDRSLSGKGTRGVISGKGSALLRDVCRFEHAGKVSYGQKVGV